MHGGILLSRKRWKVAAVVTTSKYREAFSTIFIEETTNYLEMELIGSLVTYDLSPYVDDTRYLAPYHTSDTYVACVTLRVFFFRRRLVITSCSLGKSLQMSIFVNLSLIAQQPIKIVPCLTVEENET